MKVIILVCVLTIGCGSYTQEVKSVVSEQVMKEEKQVPEDINIGDESLQRKEQFREHHEDGKLKNNDTLTVKLDNDLIVQGTKLGVIVVPDLPEEDIDLQYQPENIYEIEENFTSARSTIMNEDSMFTEDEVLNTAATLEEETESSTVMKLQPESEEKLDESLYSKLKDILETTIELPTTDKHERKPPNHVNETVKVSHLTVTRINCTSKKTFPRLDFEMDKQVYTGDHDNKIKRNFEHEPSLKKFERRTFSSWNFLDIDDKKHESIVKITKEVPYPVPYPVEKKVPFPVKVEVDRPIPIEVPKPYPVSFEKNVFFPIREYIRAPYPVYRKLPYFIQISVDKPIPFHIPRPYPVYIEKKVPYPVEKQIKIPINVPVDRPIPVHIPLVRNVYYPIERKVHYPVPVSVEKPVAVPVEKPYPVYIEKKVPKPLEEHFPYPIKVEHHNTGINQHYNFQNEDVESFANHKTEHIGNHKSPSFGVKDGSIVHLSQSTNGYDHISFQKKEDNEPEESKTEEIFQESITTQLPLEKETTHEERNTTETDHDFGKKIIKVL